MTQVTFRIRLELNDFLSAERSRREFPYTFQGPVAVKHAIEALGIPHVEVALILVETGAVGFSYLIGEGDRIVVYPAGRDAGQEYSPSLRPAPASPPRFAVDGHLGQLAKYLRLLGFDTFYRNDVEDEAIAHISQDQERILLTRDVRLLMRKNIVHGYWLRSKEPVVQIREVLGRYGILDMITPWRRCLRCNGELDKVAKEEIVDRLEPLTKLHYHEFHLCCDCGQIYWKGSHYEPLRQIVQEILDEKG
jgi:uncharacterized protein with PIN domain